MTTKAETTPSPERTVTITRLIDAPRALVFAAWTDSQHVAQWWGPIGFTSIVPELDARPGGRLRIVMRGPDGVDYPMTGVFQEIVPPERLVYSFVAENADGSPLLEGLTTVTFAEQGGKTMLTLHASAVGLVAAAAFALDGMELGWTQTLDRLTQHVAPHGSTP